VYIRRETLYLVAERVCSSVVQCTAQCIDTILLYTNLCNVLNHCPIFNSTTLFDLKTSVFWLQMAFTVILRINSVHFPAQNWFLWGTNYLVNPSLGIRGSAVRIVTGYGLDYWGVGVLSPGRVKNFLFSKSSRPALGSIQLLIQRVPGALFPG
jgi:hypothetical protein